MKFKQFLQEAKLSYKKITFTDGKNEMVIVRSSDDMPSVGDVIDSAANTLDHKSPDFKLYDNVKIKKILKIEDK